VKGAYFFDEEFERGPDWYFSHFPLRSTVRAAERFRGRPVRSGEASPYYLFHPLAAERAAGLVPDAKVIALLRHPVERAHSHFRERRANGTEPLEDFGAAVAAEEGRLKGEVDKILHQPGYRSVAHRHQSYVAQSEYLRGLQRWWDHYGRDNVLVIRSEDLYSDPQGVFDQVCDTVGLDRIVLRDPKVFNAQPKSSIDPALYASLQEQLTPGVRALEAELGRDLDWW
jgi:hypothetical protein